MTKKLKIGLGKLDAIETWTCVETLAALFSPTFGSGN